MSKTILVTGGSSGIGFEACRQLYALGNTILFVGRDENRCREAKQKIEEAYKALSLVKKEVN